VKPYNVSVMRSILYQSVVKLGDVRMWNVLSVASFILPPSFLSLLPHPLPISCPLSMVPVCLSSNALDSISVVVYAGFG